MNTLLKLFFLVMWCPGFIVGFFLRLMYQGVIIGKEVADNLLEKTE
jgi:hypothetical protein